MGETVVDRTAFEKKLKTVVESQKGSRVMWDNSYVEKVKNILCGKAEKDHNSHYYLRMYELIEEYYPKLWEAHQQNGHGGRDRMYYYLKTKWQIPTTACEIFITCCESCTRKKPVAQKGVVSQPIIPYSFNARVQMDLIDYQSCPDGEFRFL
ncbi:hypothetical protein QAD02_012684 [Eretmocerus hayati]|uniref:Uncharacterized protein n=1 Tax=Eretmocerus hayati TaxID=131215 RepID=A0ACC2P0K8_9HYME|nr:hypothetical protein QAD02_012684 [Eretmocerus hayati]